jgi:pimeloyl-ACP methyl ester carboxylesterase
MLRLGRTIGLGACLLGCSGADEPGQSVDEARGRAVRTVCFAGRSAGADPYASGGTRQLDTLCTALPGLVRDPAGSPDARYPFFRWNTSLAHVLDVIVGQLDTNHDGKVTTDDAPADLTLIGHSWGGFNAQEIATAILTDRRFAPERRTVHRLVALDAYRTDGLTTARPDMRVPANVTFFEAFRHTRAPSDDCSIIVPGWIGPFTGRDPLCTGTSTCKDYDFSLDSATADVDHCEVVARSAPFVTELVHKRPIATALPPERPVRRY